MPIFSVVVWNIGTLVEPYFVLWTISEVVDGGIVAIFVTKKRFFGASNK